MEINYNTIINILCPNILDSNNESKLTVGSNDLPENILELLTSDSSEKFYKYIDDNSFFKKGLKDQNFIRSILVVLDEKFIELDKTEQMDHIKQFIDYIRQKIISTKFKFELKYKFPRNIVIERIDNNDFNDGLIFQLITQILDINIFIFEEVEDSVKISTLFYGDNMDPWKNIILLNKQNNEFNPIITINKKLFSYNDKVITNLLNNSFSDIEYVNSSYLNKEFSLTDNLESIVDEIIDTSSRINKVDSSEQVESNFKASDLDVEIESIATNPTVSISPKKNLFTKTDFKNMKKNEIIDIVKDLKINYSSSDTKVVLIDKLISFQDSSKNKNSIQSSSS